MLKVNEDSAFRNITLKLHKIAGIHVVEFSRESILLA